MKYPVEIACIIDDDDMYITLLTKVIDLKKLAKNLLIFKNGQEALDYFIKVFQNIEEAVIPEVILLDLNMPIMNGWELLNKLAEYNFPALKKSTIYIVSSSINPIDLERSKEFNLVHDFIIKPISPSELTTIFEVNVA